MSAPAAPRRVRARRALVAVSLVLLVALSACGGSQESSKPVRRPAPTSAPAPTTVASQPTEGIAKAKAATVDIFTSPETPAPQVSLPNPWLVNDSPTAAVQQVFLVTATRPGWVQVLLPSRPNGSQGWVRADDVDVTPVRYRIDVSLGERQLRVLDGDREVLSDRVAVGAPDTPTPEGLFYVRVLMESPNPNSGYGRYAYGLSGHSEVLDAFNGGDAEIGIHGNNNASVLGQAVSHGCIRMSNDKIAELTRILPLGTPVTIHA